MGSLARETMPKTAKAVKNMEMATGRVATKLSGEVFPEEVADAVGFSALCSIIRRRRLLLLVPRPLH